MAGSIDSSTVILGNTRRMMMIEFLQQREGHAELRELVEYIAEREGDTNRKHRKSVYVSLIQTHIPKLEREGVVTFNHGIVTLLKIPEDVTVYMEVVNKHDISWSTFYMGTSVIFIIAGWYLGSMSLLLAAMVYLVISIIHHRKIKRLF
ncbi:MULTISPECIES: DUF7344 domain-containing protein [Thermococcus]|uniref:DUF7344 domain-containing protein n=1 Tax=Thermococcus thioreducens TaxID=277988 RepID=A0A0Q2QRJ2_9EURY|nr:MULTISPECIES: hypothetical protein [Thermococcus]ASJ11658.1 hypothetical protein A3L14_01585 [Thermococcus thioreducens]KQH82605.1 hypothetical protein AMR53_04850 [Thermococcus thioreducens]SEW16109.1 hypothetical protein SAMN05216170_1964 [Thermococcus thioreducens]